MRISDSSSDVCSSDLVLESGPMRRGAMRPWILGSGLCLAPLLLAGCSGAHEPPRLTEKQTSELERALAGKVPGEKTSCVNRESQSNLTAISNSVRSEEHTSELQSLMRISYAVFCLKKKK